jgi:hypothetical protein
MRLTAFLLSCLCSLALNLAFRAIPGFLSTLRISFGLRNGT